LPYIETKKLIPIAVMSNNRLSELPKTPTFRELDVTALDQAQRFCTWVMQGIL
jgi:hypothetical protein